MPEQNEHTHQPSKRRTGRKRRPRWQRTLRRYWPPIRFGLICLALLLILIFLITGLVRLIGGLGSDETKTTAPSSSETTQSTQATQDTQAQIAQTLADAEFIAAGYDYMGAIELLQSSELYAASAEMQSNVTEYTQLDSQLISYPEMNNITHVFFHTLVVDNARAFDGDSTEDGYNQYMTTIREFNLMMESMYEKGYVLVSPYDVAYEVTDETGTHFVQGDIRLPEGKIPFLMSQDDVCYYGYMLGDVDPEYQRPAVPHPEGDGFAHKLVIGEDGYPTCEYMDAQGNITTGDYDLVPLLEKFIQEHPDFSYHGARAMLAMTGYEGVFGYRTKPAYETALGAEAYAKECANASALADCLREHGWVLASHSYGHRAYGNLTAAGVEADADKWDDTVERIIGQVDVLIYPNGSDIEGVGKYTMDNPKFKALYEDGFRYFFNVDSHYAWCQLGENYYRGGRRNLDGYRMYYNPDSLSDLFDVSAVWDPDRPTPVPPI